MEGTSYFTHLQSDKTDPVIMSVLKSHRLENFVEQFLLMVKFI
jgi:hypothetical protein